MTVKDKHKEFKYKYPKYLVLLEVGSFYQTFSEDGIILHNIFNYKIMNDRVGFPKTSLSKITTILDLKHINYVLISDNPVIRKFKDNNYDKYTSTLGLTDIELLDKYISKLEDLRYSDDLHLTLEKLKGIL